MNEDLISHVIQSDLLIPHLEVIEPQKEHKSLPGLVFFNVFFGCSPSTEITPTSRPGQIFMNFLDKEAITHC